MVPAYTHDLWMESTGIPIHRGYHVEDLRTVELGWWAEREYNAAFIQLEGMKGITEVRVTEIPPGGTLPPLKLAFDEAVYVLQGYGLTSVWQGDPSTSSGRAARRPSSGPLAASSCCPATTIISSAIPAATHLSG